MKRHCDDDDYRAAMESLTEAINRTVIQIGAPHGESVTELADDLLKLELARTYLYDVRGSSTI